MEDRTSPPAPQQAPPPRPLHWSLQIDTRVRPVPLARGWRHVYARVVDGRLDVEIVAIAALVRAQPIALDDRGHATGPRAPAFWATAELTRAGELTLPGAGRVLVLAPGDAAPTLLCDLPSDVRAELVERAKRVDGATEAAR